MAGGRRARRDEELDPGQCIGRSEPGEPVPVLVTAYCLSGTTRRGRYVRPGIVAADRKLFPLSRYIELYAGEKYLGRFLIDDTGSKIRGAHIDVWVPTCREAKIFGRQHGTAMLLPRPEMQVVQAGASEINEAAASGKDRAAEVDLDPNPAAATRT